VIAVVNIHLLALQDEGADAILNFWLAVEILMADRDI
jgi:hypothetical protein